MPRTAHPARPPASVSIDELIAIAERIEAEVARLRAIAAHIEGPPEAPSPQHTEGTRNDPAR